MVSLTIKQIREAQLAYVRNGGTNDDTLQAKYYARPISYLITWLLVKKGIDPNEVTTLAFLCAIVGLICFISGTHWILIIGAVIFNIGHLLDYVDGTLAKATNTVSNFGRYYDSVLDEMVEAIIAISVGCAVGLAFVGAFCAILHLISVVSRLYYQKYYELDSGANKQVSLVLKVGINLKAMAVPILLIAVLTNWLLVFFVLYAIMTTCELIARLAMGVRIEDRES